jgi:hypothetical protein
LGREVADEAVCKSLPVAEADHPAVQLRARSRAFESVFIRRLELH